MAEIWQHLAAVAASDRPWRLLFKKLAMKNSSARRNDISISKCWALSTLLYSTLLYFTATVSLYQLPHLHSRHDRDDSECEKYIARSIFLGFGLTCRRLRCQAMADILARHLSSRAPALRVVDGIHKLFLHARALAFRLLPACPKHFCAV